MTLVDVKNVLFSHFITDSVFSLKDDVAPIKFPPKVEDEICAQYREQIFKAALDDFTKAGLTSEVGPGVYILSQPLDTLNQTVQLSPMVVEMITDLLSTIMVPSEDGEGEPYQYNKFALSNDDLGALCSLCHELMDNENDEE